MLALGIPLISYCKLFIAAVFVGFTPFIILPLQSIKITDLKVMVFTIPGRTVRARNHQVVYLF